MVQMEIRPSRILVVDDILDNLNMLMDLLEEYGHDVQKAISGKEALELVEQSPPDLILLDIQMPVMDGYEVCRRLKADPKTQAIPIIFLSALTETDDILKGFEVGGIDYVSKPFQFREVAARVHSQLNLVHQRREIEHLREKDRQQFEQVEKMRKQFLQMSVHDLKNPLSGVIMWGRVLRDLKADEFDRISDIAQVIDDSASKMQRLVMDLLDLTEMQIGGNRLNIAEHDIVTILKKSFNTNVMVAKEDSIEVILEAPDTPINIRIDGHQIERVFDNLISNAIKYTPEEGKVCVSIRALDECVEVLVEDTGLGIPDDAIDHLFEAFFRVKEHASKKRRGTGLGLSIVKAIVEQHRGVIDVESKVGEGSSFRVRLPL